MAKKLKSLNPIIGTGYKTLSTIKDGEDGNIENFPDTLPKIPRLSYKRLGVSGLEIGWEFEDKIYYTYELYGSTTKGFEASEENLIFQGLASSYFYEAKPGEKWYFKARAKNTHGRYTEFSSELVTYTIKLDNLGDYVEGESINGALIENATINNAHIKDLHANKITAGVLDADRIGANSITANKIEANAITSEKIQANAITTDKLAANIIASNHIQSGTITSGHIQSGTIESGHIKAGTIESNHIKSNSINSNHIQANTIQSGHIQTGAITAGSGIIAEGAIGSAQISSLDAAKIEAGTIDTSKVTVQGTNGHLRIKGNRLQVFNGTGNKAKERVSVGDVNGDGTVYGLRVRGADGTTVLLDENGVTKEGITDGSITNDKISDNAEIDGAKLNINSVVSKINEDGTEVIKGTKIEVDGTTLTTKLSNITTKQTENSNKITQAQTQIKANENAIKLKVDTQTYQTDKNNTQTSLNKHTSEISALQDEIALKVDKTGVEEIIDEVSGELIDSKIDTAKAEIKVTTDKISQNVTNLTNTVSKKADGSTVTTLSNKVGTLETSVNGISGKVTNLETTTTTLNSNVTKAQNTANTANSTANSNKTNITNLQGEVNTVKSDVASLEVTTSGISQKVSSVESTTSSLTTKVNNAQSTADSKAKVFTTTPTTPYRVGDLWVQGTSGDMMRCKTARTSGSYTASDWEKASKYTDDTKANAVDNKVGTLQSDYNSTKSKVATLETNLDGITQRVSSTESTTSNLSSEINGVKGNVSNLTNRVSNAESKLTKDSLTTTIGNHYTTKTDVDGIVTSKGYQTQSQVQQTVDGLQVKVQQSGGYNLIRNSTGASGNTSGWTHNGSSMAVGSNDNIGSANKNYLYLNNGTTTSERYAYSSRFKLKPNTKYRFTGYFHNYTKCPNFDVFVLSSTSLSDTDTTTNYTNVHNLISAQNTNGSWKKFTTTFTTPANTRSGILRIDNNGYNSSGTGDNNIHWSCLTLTEGELEVPWSPHPSEIYDGITTIDKNGITVTASNAKSKTNMSANGFKITKTDTNEDVFKVNSDGTLYMKGQITVTGGSVPTSNLSGTISSNQLNSSITSDINNAKNNASSALSTANTAKSTADSVNTTVNNGKTNWNNAYNRVNQWAYGAVTGNTTIDGGYIQTNTIVADKIASGAVTTDKLNAQAVTADKIKTGSITATQIAARTITASEIASNAITADKIASNSITSAKIASGAITANMITSGTMSANRITGGTLKSTNGNMYFDMDNGYMILYNNGTKVGQTLMNNISGTSIYGISNGCEYGSYATMSARTSSSASTYTMMLSVAGKDLSNNVKYGVNLGTILTSHGNNFNLHNSYLCFGLGASSYSTVGQIRWYSDSSNWSWIGITNSNNIGLFGQGGVRLGARVSSSNTSYIGADANADSYSCKAHIWSNLNMHNWKIRYCQGVSTASLEINEEIPFARSASSDGEEGEILTNSYNVVKTKQNIVETMGSVTITEDMVDKEVYIELDAYMAYKNYMVILSPVGEDRKVCVLRKEDDGFYIKGNKGDVDYIIKYECIDVARYRNSTGEDAPENIVEEKENEPKPIILEEQI